MEAASLSKETLRRDEAVAVLQVAVAQAVCCLLGRARRGPESVGPAYCLSREALDHPTDESLKAVLADNERMRCSNWAISGGFDDRKRIVDVRVIVELDIHTRLPRGARAIRWVEVIIWRVVSSDVVRGPFNNATTCGSPWSVTGNITDKAPWVCPGVMSNVKRLPPTVRIWPSDTLMSRVRLGRSAGSFRDSVSAIRSQSLSLARTRAP